MAGTIKRLSGPALIVSTTATTTDMFTPPAATIYTVVKHIHIANIDSSARTFSMYLGATTASAAGTQLFEDVSIAAGSYFDWYGNMKIVNGEIITANASATNILVCTIMGEQYVV